MWVGWRFASVKDATTLAASYPRCSPQLQPLGCSALTSLAWAPCMSFWGQHGVGEAIRWKCRGSSRWPESRLSSSCSLWARLCSSSSPSRSYCPTSLALLYALAVHRGSVCSLTILSSCASSGSLKYLNRWLHYEPFRARFRGRLEIDFDQFGLKFYFSNLSWLVNASSNSLSFVTSRVWIDAHFTPWSFHHTLQAGCPHGRA